MRRILVFISILCTFCEFSIFAQNTKEVPFNGKVTDIAGNPAKGAKVYVQKGLFARVDKKGRFGLTNVNVTDTVKIEYQKKIYYIPVEGRKSLSVVIGDQIDNYAQFMAEEDIQLVDWGYGYVKKREILDPRSGISGEILRRTGSNNVLDALSGLVPGLRINKGGAFGAPSTANIRGVNSINLPTEPLYIVDGVETSSLDHISPYDVDNVEILKDGSMYGIKGANGVIIVHTIGGAR